MNPLSPYKLFYTMMAMELIIKSRYAYHQIVMLGYLFWELWPFDNFNIEILRVSQGSESSSCKSIS